MIPRPLRLALAPIRSAIVLARFVFRKTTTKTPFRDSKSLRDPPSVAPGVILEVEACRRSSHSDCFSVAAAARRPEEGERERHYLRNVKGFDFLPRRLLDLKICLRTLSMRIPSCHRSRRRRRSL